MRTNSHLRDQKHLLGQIWPVVLICGLAACASSERTLNSTVADPDGALVQAVYGALRSDELPVGGLDVSANAGTVQISGTAPSVAVLRRILRVAGSVGGVRTLVNRVRVVGDGAG
ncbi:MAG: BON domain-containing protein [Acidobacteria bacterium]|nr:BON domain-containing protein [Acidobacteriota bacterium]